MKENRKLKICFMGGNQAGLIGALTILSKEHQILSAVSFSDDVSSLFERLGTPVYESVEDEGFTRDLKDADVLFSVHGREIVSDDLLKFPRFGGVNVHPYLYKYKGADPVGTALKNGDFKASVGAHVMESAVDEGEVLVEDFTDVSGSSSVTDIYNRLYPYYCSVILKVLEMYDGKK